MTTAASAQITLKNVSLAHSHPACPVLKPYFSTGKPGGQTTPKTRQTRIENANLLYFKALLVCFSGCNGF
jgi:hypothetical protein